MAEFDNSLGHGGTNLGKAFEFASGCSIQVELKCPVARTLCVARQLGLQISF